MAVYPPKRKIAEKGESNSIWQMDVKSFLGIRSHMGLAQTALFCRKISFLLDSGLSLRSAMSILGEQVKNKNLAKITQKLHNLLESGESFSSALCSVGVFPPFMCGYVEIGEKTGEFAEVFRGLADYYEEHSKIESELTAAMIYPIMVVVVMLGVVVLAVALVLPGYEEIFTYSGVQMPVFTAALISGAAFVSQNAVILLLLIIFVNVSLLIFFKTTAGRYVASIVKLRSSLVKKSVNLKISDAIALLLQSKISVPESVKICTKIIGNEKVKQDLKKIEQDIRKGKPFWLTLSEFSYIDPILLELVKIGEESGSLPATVKKCSDYLLSEYKASIKRLNKLVEPVITVVLGAVLALIMLAVVLPTFELAQVM